MDLLLGRDWRRQLRSLDPARQPPTCPSLALQSLFCKVLLELLRPVGRSLPDWCEAPAAAHWLPVVVTAAAAADVAERERRRDSCSWLILVS